MRTWARTRPARLLPPLHAPQLRRVIELNNAINLSVRMLMILSSVLFLAFHVNRGDREVARFCAWQRNLAPTVFLAVDWDGRAPAFVVLDAALDQTAEVVVEWVSGAVVLIQIGFGFVPGSATVMSAAMDCYSEASYDAPTYRFCTSAKNSFARSTSALAFGY